MVEVDGNHRLINISEHAFERTISRFNDRSVDLFGCYRAACVKAQVNHGYVRCWYADRGAIKLACKLRQDEAYGFCRTG